MPNKVIWWVEKGGSFVVPWGLKMRGFKIPRSLYIYLDILSTPPPPAGPTFLECTLIFRLWQSDTVPNTLLRGPVSRRQDFHKIFS